MKNSFSLVALFRNKVLVYAISRYLVSGVSFLTSLILAVKLGSYFLGIWGFILLLRRYFQLINFGIPDSTTVLLIKCKDNNTLSADYIKSSVGWILLLSGVIILFAISHSIFNYPFISRYGLTWEFYIVCITSCLTLLNDLFQKIARVRGRVFELTFYQSIIQILSFAIVLICNTNLIPCLVLVYLLGNILSMYLFVKNGNFPFTGKFRLGIAKEIIRKGIYIFLYNFFFYLVMMFTRTIISSSYEIADFGNFTFAYTLANSIILLVDAVAALLIPKLLDKYNTNDTNAINQTIAQIRVNYMHVSYILLFVMLIFFTILLKFFKDYNMSFSVVVYTSMTIALQSHSFAYTTLLLTKNKEKELALCSMVAVFANVALVSLYAYYFHLPYQYLVLATWVSYAIHAILCIYFARKTVNESGISVWGIIAECFPLSISMPTLCLFSIAYTDQRIIIFLPLVLYILLNQSVFKHIALSLKKIIVNPNIVDIKK